MKLKKIFALCISAALMMTGCIQKNDDVELSEEEKEHNAVIGWFENDMFDEEEFTDLTDYRYYARTIGLEKDELLSPDMWEVYYSESININKEIDGSAVYLNGAGLLMHIFKYATPVLSVVMLAITVAKSSDITKRALGG